MKNSTTLIITILVLLQSLLFAQSKQEQIDDLLSRYYDYKLFNGTALVAEKGKIIFEKGYGLANIEWNIPNKPDVKFRIGSITKQFTAALIMQFVEEGKIKLEGKITDYLPNYRKDTGDKVTIRELLNHTSGIKSYTNIPHMWSDSSRNHYTEEYFIKHFQSGDLEFEPGTSFAYNNTGYYLLAAIIEKVTHKTFGEVLKEKILIPLGMENSGAEEEEIPIAKKASGYLKFINKYMLDPYIYMPNAMGAGNMYSTVEDMYKWDRALYTNKILSQESKKEMFTPNMAKYGFGWFIAKAPMDTNGDSLDIVWHTGGINGFNTIIFRIVSDSSLVLLFNNNGTAPLISMANKITKLLYNEEIKYPKKPISLQLAEIIDEDGIQEAVKAYHQLKKEESESFYFSEKELNNLGYELMNENKINEAIEIFKLNIESYPESYNTYDSMGEAYMKKGNNKLAIENYKKSIELNARNTNAYDMLKKLGVNISPPKEFKIDEKTAKSYTGKYQLMPNFFMVITADGNKVYEQATGQPKFEIFPESQDKFYMKVVEAKIVFKRDKNGKVNELVLYQSGKVIPGKKVK